MKIILDKLLKIQKEIGTMKKDGYNEHSNYNYLSEKQATAILKDLFDKYGIIFDYNSKILEHHITPSGKQTVYDVQVDYGFVDVESGEIKTGTAVGSGSDSTDKGVYKAITGAIKYIYMKTFNIPTGDDPEKDVQIEDKKETRKDYQAKNKQAFENGEDPFLE